MCRVEDERGQRREGVFDGLSSSRVAVSREDGDIPVNRQCSHQRVVADYARANVPILGTIYVGGVSDCAEAGDGMI